MWWIIVIACVMLFFFYASYNIGSGVYVKTFCRKKTTDKVVALTFDDGPDATYTPQVLDILKRHHAPAAFFCIGEKAEKYPTIVQRAFAEGHLIGNHSHSHTNRFPLLPRKQMISDLQQAQQILEQTTGSPVTFFRPPFGVTNPTIAKAVRQLGYTTIGWSVRSLDTRKEPISRILRRVTRQLSPGAVILLHDRLPDSPELLRQLLEYLHENDYKIIRVDQLIPLQNLSLQNKK